MLCLDNMEIHELNDELFCKWMNEHGRFARMGVQGDGSCFFHSVCAMLNYNNYLFLNEKKQRDVAYAYRCGFAKKFTDAEYAIFSKKSNSPKSFKQEKDGFCSPKVWADEVMIRHASKVLNINLIFIDLRRNKAYCGVHGEKTVEELSAGSLLSQSTGIVAWINNTHFEPIVRVEDSLTGEITTLFDPSIPKDASFIQSLMKKYQRDCRI